MCYENLLKSSSRGRRTRTGLKITRGGKPISVNQTYARFFCTNVPSQEVRVPAWLSSAEPPEHANCSFTWRGTHIWITLSNYSNGVITHVDHKEQVDPFTLQRGTTDGFLTISQVVISCQNRRQMSARQKNEITQKFHPHRSEVKKK